MSLETLVEKAKGYEFSQEKIDSQERGRLEFISKFPLERIKNLTVDEYVAGTDKNSFSYWVEFKNILCGIGGGNASKFGIYKGKDGNYYEEVGPNKTPITDEKLVNEFQKIKTGILTALDYVKNDRISEIRYLDIPIWKMVLQKILIIYYPDKFLSIVASDALISLANDIGLKNVDLDPKNLIEINYKCRNYLNSNSEFKDWNYEKLSTLVWANYRKDIVKSDLSTSDNINYWLYAPGENADMWEGFYSQGIMALGWDKLGDLSEYKSKEEIANKLLELENATGSKKNDATANYEFRYEISIGDTVIVKKGRTELLGYGIVSSDYYFDSSRSQYKSCRKVDWKKKGVWHAGHSLALKTLTNITKYSSDDPNYRRYSEMLMALMNKARVKINDYKEAYLQWLDKSSSENSRKKSSYQKAIEILSDILHENLFEQNDLGKLELLYKDLVKEQGVEDGKYFYKDAPSYGNSGFYSAAIKSYSDFIEEVYAGKSKSTSSKSMTQLNTILFGPPGTGKTYNTINKALDIIGADVQGKDRKGIKDIFDAKMKEGQIVFTTFHQSMSYEDFIEGIKPVEPKIEGQPVIYRVIDGIFKKACAIAAYNSYKIFSKSKIRSEKYSFDDLYDAFTQSIQEQIKSDKPPVYKTLRGREVEVKEINSNDSIIARAKNSIAKSSAPLTKENLQKLYDRFKDIDEIEDLKDVQETVQITPRITEFYAVFAGLKEFEKEFKPDEQLITESKEVEALNFEEIEKKFNAGVYKDAIRSFGSKAEPVVMIIDEINRGNVSQIFGELITLIEEDKRQGKDEELEVTLPYSQDKFGVPPNLYIIGTMNTADRSVEALDAALRRRFSFEEMPPKYELEELQYEFAGTEVHLILETINKRIERLLDKDHAIGHSYFIFKNGDDMPSKMLKTFYNNIIPLLQEYFYGDYGKIGMVLGKGFIRKKEWNNKVDSFADFDYESSSDFDDKDIYKIIDYRNQNISDSIMLKKEKEERIVQLTFERAIKLLMNQDVE